MTDDMYSLLGKHFSGQATAAEEAEIQQWLEASEENRMDFHLLEKLWNRSGEQEPIVFDTAKAWQAVNTRIKTSAAPVRRMRPVTRAIAVAAAVILLFGMWWLFQNLTGDKTIVATVAMKEVQLEDGSTVYLRRGASLRFPRKFADNSREVSLEGEAFFEVTPDAAKPFIITAAQTKVEVVGTSFTVNTNNNAVELIVKTGRVRFGAAAQPQNSLLVSAGERARYANDALTKGVNTDVNFDAWQSGQLVFSNMPLPEVIRVLNNYYSVSIRIRPTDATQLSAARLTARFNKQPLSAVLEEISLITSYRIQQTGDAQYEISIK